MIRESIQQNIIQIKRKSSRAIRVTLDQGKAIMPIHVISTYAPHSGHNEETRQRRQDVQELLNKTSKQHLIIWEQIQMDSSETETKPKKRDTCDMQDKYRA